MGNLWFRDQLDEESWIHDSRASCGSPTIQVWLKRAGKVTRQQQCHGGARPMVIHICSETMERPNGERLLSSLVHPHPWRGRWASSEHCRYLPHDKTFLERSSQVWLSGSQFLQNFLMVLLTSRKLFAPPLDMSSILFLTPESSKNHISVGNLLDMKR